MPENDGFYTMKGYSMLSDGKISSAMEDYLEMIARLRQKGSAVRAVDLSAKLHVKASSVSKMIQQLAQAGLVLAPKYGEISLTEQGAALGSYLLHRHTVLHAFLCLLNGTANELEQVEKIEHFLNEQTIQNLEKLVRRLQQEG